MLAVMHSSALCTRLASQRSCGSTASTSYVTVSLLQGRSANRRAPGHSQSSDELCLSHHTGSLRHAFVKAPRLRARHLPLTRCAYQYDVVGLAQAMVDFGATVDDGFLESFEVEKGGRRWGLPRYRFRNVSNLPRRVAWCKCDSLSASVPQERFSSTLICKSQPIRWLVSLLFYSECQQRCPIYASCGL